MKKDISECLCCNYGDFITSPYVACTEGSHRSPDPDTPHRRCRGQNWQVRSCPTKGRDSISETTEIISCSSQTTSLWSRWQLFTCLPALTFCVAWQASVTGRWGRDGLAFWWLVTTKWDIRYATSHNCHKKLDPEKFGRGTWAQLTLATHNARTGC